MGCISGAFVDHRWYITHFIFLRHYCPGYDIYADSVNNRMLLKSLSLLLLVGSAVCLDSKWVKYFPEHECQIKCVRTEGVNCTKACASITEKNSAVCEITSSTYDWDNRRFVYTLPDGSNKTSECLYFVDLGSLYDQFELTMRSLYRENNIVPMRLYRNTSDEFKGLMEKNDARGENDTHLPIPYKFIMSYSGTQPEQQEAVDNSINTFLGCLSSQDYTYSSTLDTPTPDQHTIVITQHSSGRREPCHAGYKEHAYNHSMICIADMCAPRVRCVPNTTRTQCSDDEYRLLGAGTESCRTFPLNGSKCHTLLQYIYGAPTLQTLDADMRRVLPRIIDVICSSSSPDLFLVLVDAIDSTDDYEATALAGLMGIPGASASAGCCTTSQSTGTFVCRMCSYEGGGRRLLAGGGVDNTKSWYRVKARESTTPESTVEYVLIARESTTPESTVEESSGPDVLVIILVILALVLVFVVVSAVWYYYHDRIRANLGVARSDGHVIKVQTCAWVPLAPGHTVHYVRANACA